MNPYPAGPPTPTSAPSRRDPLSPWPDTVIWRPVSRRLIALEEAHLLASVAGALVVCLVVWVWLHPWIAPLTALVVVAVGLFRAVFVVRSVRAWGYAERDVDLLVRHGLFVRRLSIVPYARMQFVDVTAGPLERLLGLATVVLHTASPHSDARVPGLPGDEAARLRDRLTALGEVRAEGL